MNILLLASHAVAEYDDLRMLTDLGYDVFCPGGYQNPATGIEGMRPGLPNAPYHADLAAACDAHRAAKGDPGVMIDWAKANIPELVLDWSDVIICHHYLDRWIAPQWAKLRGKRVIWRTCGQSDPDLEFIMGRLRDDGLQIVRYSPKEERMYNFAGQDALIRFGKYVDDYGPWDGHEAVVFNTAQHDVKPHERDRWLTFSFWEEATAGLPAIFAGPNSEAIGGIGGLSYEAMLDRLNRSRAYLYTGTVAAPYTLGLMEAMLTGIPTVSIGPNAWNGPAPLFEAAEIAECAFDDPKAAGAFLRALINDQELAREMGERQRRRATELFSVATVGPQWVEFLG